MISNKIESIQYSGKLRTWHHFLEKEATEKDPFQEWPPLFIVHMLKLIFKGIALHSQGQCVGRVIGVFLILIRDTVC